MKKWKWGVTAGPTVNFFGGYVVVIPTYLEIMHIPTVH